ncbi:MAG: hypothetical protein ACO2PM_00460 [Pyrobaculum sp.]|jgi:hypothetical protein
MPKKYVVIPVFKEVKKILAMLKVEMEVRSYDQVVRELLRRAGYAVP